MREDEVKFICDITPSDYLILSPEVDPNRIIICISEDAVSDGEEAAIVIKTKSIGIKLAREIVRMSLELPDEEE